MSSRSRSSRERHKGGHAHCDSCYTRRCRARVEPSVCCPLSTCRLLCGALYHLCKEEDHLLLCPNVRAPCINAEFGCPLQMLRSSRAEHLQFCPASVVSCSMEWLRWLEDETNPNSFLALQENLLKERCEEREEREEALDVSLALVDQSELYSRLKMKPLYPELMEEEEEEEEKKEGSAVGGTLSGEAEEEQGSPLCESVSAEEPVNMSRSQMLGLTKGRSSIMDMMFGMERGACAVAESKQDHPTQKDKTGAKERDGKQTAGVKSEPNDTENHEAEVDTSKTGHAPWQQGVLERLGKDLTPQEYNMYIVHHGRMLMAFGHIQACTPREKDFVYGSLEPIPVQTLRSFKVPDSYHYRSRVHLYENTVRALTEARETDTSDLSSSEDQWFSDEAKITLLGYAEMEVMGHKICELKAADGLYVDEGTQTYSFRSAPFTSQTKLSDTVADTDGPPRLLLQLQAESVNSRNNRVSAFAFVCGHVFHRREFPTHVRNVHCDIQTGLSGWFEQRCPLSYLGCTYSYKRFQPSTHKATVTYNQDLKTFNLRPAPVCPLWNHSETAGEDPLSALPFEVLCHVASFLDSLSLSQLALVSQLMRQVCSSQLEDKGMVSLHWDRTSSKRGRSQWTAKPVWEFSRLFSKVDSWEFSEISSISSHLKVCPFYERHVHSARVLLPCLSTKQKNNTQKASLVNLFTKNKTL
ncbi:F-box only protein 40-like isoform X2 [Eucyclogobius newberryi]